MKRYTIHAALLAAVLNGSAAAQGTDAQNTVDTIVGSEVLEHESSTTADHGRIVAAIDKAGEAAEAVRKVDSVESVEIVFLPDASLAEGGPPADIAAKLEHRATEVKALRQEIEGNALLFHAIDSRQVLTRDVLGIDIGADQRIVIYAAAKLMERHQ